MVLLVQIFGKQLILLFTPASPEVLEEGILYLRICCSVNSLVYAVMYTFDSFAIGIGSANIAMFNALLDAGIVRLPVSWLLGIPPRSWLSGHIYRSGPLSVSSCCRRITLF